MDEVSKQNRALGYYPIIFERVTREVEGAALIGACTGLIFSGDALKALEKALGRHPDLLTLEDLVAGSAYGRAWGFNEDVVRQAEASVEWFDMEVGCQRWSV